MSVHRLPRCSVLTDTRPRLRTGTPTRRVIVRGYHAVTQIQKVVVFKTLRKAFSALALLSMFRKFAKVQLRVQATPSEKTRVTEVSNLTWSLQVSVLPDD